MSPVSTLMRCPFSCDSLSWSAPSRDHLLFDAPFTIYVFDASSDSSHRPDQTRLLNLVLDHYCTGRGGGQQDCSVASPYTIIFCPRIMAFQALKEAKIPGAMCRLTPPNSPSRITGTSGPSRPVHKSRILAALDAELDALNGENSRYSHSRGEITGRNAEQARQSTRSYPTLAQSSVLEFEKNQRLTNAIYTT